ncbi:cutinase family protein [Amycolatopsis magusensis]|uniref:cutinase family protein n=1 Tax=Amycolatopsis magusensis TaxID=882444 RepID=UPI0024A8370F|nr:cutinase family protein [Amycolatopsis magusensis]MDI5981123.1 cutinase family protein [Amycolatopsis magusensis]
MKKRLVALLTGALATAGLLVAGAPAASAAPCGGTYTIAVGGFNDPTSGIFSGNVSQRVGYSAALNSASAREGVNELNRLIRNQRNACPGQHAKVVGFSEGAAVAHIWVTENWQSFGNVNAVLISDPKRQAPPGLNGGSVPFGGIVGYPLAGADRYFGDVPVKSICHWDYVCDESAGIWTYPHNHINNYPNDWNVDHHNDNAHEQWFNGAWQPW